MDSTWWQSSLPELLDQGDIFQDVPFAFAKSPVQPLVSTNLKGGVRGWAESAAPKVDGEGNGHFLHKGPIKHAMLLNHGCDIDKPHTKRLIVVPVLPLIAAPKEQRETIQNGGVIALFYLPDVPGIGDAFADFRLMNCLAAELVKGATRFAAMSDDARTHLGARLMAFFLRVELPTSDRR